MSPLVKLENEVCGRLISEFKRIADGLGLDSAEGRAKAVAIDATLRAIDGYVERRWRELRRIAADSDPAFVRTIALRWNRWWYRELWSTQSQQPFGPEDE
jgi:hypothetical protein